MPDRFASLRPLTARGPRVLVAVLSWTALAGAARAQSTPESLASTDGPSPVVTSRSGTGTAQATATAKVTSESIRSLCAAQDPGAGADACAKQYRSELGKTYTIRADCTVGRLQPLDGKSYVLDGLWDGSDVGAGRTRWKGPDGVVVGRDSASGGLALSQQWEVLCPGRVSAAVLSKARALSSSSAGTAAATPAAPVQVCNADPSCTEVSAFAMSIVEFRASLQGSWKVLTTTLRFQNKLARPLVLGYVVGSGGATDDRGNRYVVKDAEVRGIGLIAGRADDKFVVQPGQSGDARFTLVWAGGALFGSTWDLDLTVREIVPAGNGQTTLGPEYPLQIVGLVDGTRAGSPGVAQASGSGPGTGTGAPGPAAGGAPAAPAQSAPDPQTPTASTGGLPSPFGAPPASGGQRCVAGTICQDLGTFSITAAQTAAAVSGRNQLVRFSLRVKNPGTQPLVLASRSGTSSATDELGNTYAWGRPGTHDASAAGIGIVEGTRVDPQFQVAPGGTRDFQIVLVRYDAAGKPAGRSFTLDTTLVELRAAGGQQLQKVREHPVHLSGTGGVAPAVGQNPSTDHVQKASDLLRGILGGK